MTAREHDPLCPYSEPEQDRDPNDYCGCDLIAHVRADERGWIARANADSIEAEVRERLRAQVEALPHGHDKDGTVCMIGYGAGCTCWKADVLDLLGGESNG